MRPRPVDEEVDEAVVVRGRLGLCRRAQLEQGTPEILDALAGRAREPEDAHDAVVLDLEHGRLRNEVDLVQHHGLRTRLEPGSVRLELGADRREPRGRVALARVDHVHEQPRPLEVRKELVAEPDSLARAFDQPGHVGDRRPRVRDPRQQGRLPGVRQADERSVGHELQPQLELGSLARQAGLGETRRLPGRRGEVLVPAPGRAASRSYDPRLQSRKVGDQLAVLVEDLSPHRNPELDGLPRRSVLQRAPARIALAGLEPTPAPEAGEIAEVGVGDEHDVAARAAVAAVRPTFRDVLLPAEVQAAVTAATRDHVDAGAVVERRFAALPRISSCRTPVHRAAPSARVPQLERLRRQSETLTKRRSPLCLNATVPGRVAKIVWSRPTPVPAPGRNFVPRWRTMIIPAFTSWPEKIFTPSIFGFESRPFRDEPSPFLCAI